MQLLRTTVHRNWQDITQAQMLEYSSLWRKIQAVSVASVLTVLLVSIAHFPRVWQDFLRMAASYSVFCILPLWYVYRRNKHAKRLTLIAFVLFVGIAALAALTNPLPTDPEWRAMSAWPVGFSVLILVPSSIFVLLIYRAFPTRMNWLGFTPSSWILNLMIGAMAGGILGLHFFLSADGLTGGRYLQTLDWPVLIWTFSTYAGLQALGEELLFRGLGLSVLWEGLHHSFWNAAWRVTFLNLLIYLVWLPYNRDTGIWFWLIAYRVALSFASVFLRYRQKSLVPGLAANVLFNLLVAVAIT